MKTIKLWCAVAAISIGSGCAMDDIGPSVAPVQQEVTGGVFTLLLSSQTFVANAVGALDTGPISILDGSSWLSASVSLQCGPADSIIACAREYDPSAPATSTTWCTPITACAGANTYSLPMSAFTADAHHALALNVQRSSIAVTVTSATLTEFTPGS